MSFGGYIAGLCAMAVICGLCDMLSPEGSLGSCVKAVTAFAFLAYAAQGAAALLESIF